ncbi:unnamed protein product, partial [Sphagnum tenellum]
VEGRHGGPAMAFDMEGETMEGMEPLRVGAEAGPRPGPPVPAPAPAPGPPRRSAATRKSLPRTDPDRVKTVRRARKTRRDPEPTSCPTLQVLAQRTEESRRRGRTLTRTRNRRTRRARTLLPRGERIRLRGRGNQRGRGSRRGRPLV